MAFDCRQAAEFSGEDGYVLVGQVVGAERLPAEFEPLIYTEEIFRCRPAKPEGQ